MGLDLLSERELSMSEQRVGTVTLRRDDDGEEIEIDVYQRVVNGKRIGLQRMVSPDGRDIYNKNETEFYFDREMVRVMRIVRDL